MLSAHAGRKLFQLVLYHVWQMLPFRCIVQCEKKFRAIKEYNKGNRKRKRGKETRICCLNSGNRSAQDENVLSTAIC